MVFVRAIFVLEAVVAVLGGVFLARVDVGDHGVLSLVVHAAADLFVHDREGGCFVTSPCKLALVHHLDAADAVAVEVVLFGAVANELLKF